MANKPLVIDVVSRTALNGVLDKWEPIGNIQAFTRDIITPELDENADKSAIVSGIPTVFARANMFSLALSYSGDSMANTSKGLITYYDDLIDEWKGLIACIALDSGKLTIKRIDLTYSDGKSIDKTGNLYETKGAFGNMLFNRESLWTEHTGEPGEQTPFINVIKYNSQVVGGTSPECLLFTAPSYSIPANENYAPKGKFRDPVKHGKNMDETKWLALYAYVKNLIERLKGEFTLYYHDLNESLRPNYDHIAERLTAWLIEIKSKIQDDVERAAANPVSGFTSPFSIIFNYSDSMYGSNGIILSRPEQGYTEFKAEDLLLPRGSEIARIMLNPQAMDHYSELPVQLLEATIKGSEGEEKAYFALPLSVIGLKIFGTNIAVLVGQQDNEGKSMVKSRMFAEYDPEPRENNLTVYLTLNSEDGKVKNVAMVYSVKSDRYIMNSDILLWPNFISNNWNKYYMYSEMPARVTTANFNAIPFVGHSVNGIFQPIIDEEFQPIYLTEDKKDLAKKDIDAMVLVTADHRVADSPYKYEIYQSDKPFAGVKLISGTDREGNEKMAGFLLIRYEGGGPLNNMMGKETPYQEKKVTLGFDFGSTNSSVAYYDPADTRTKSLNIRNRRVSLFGNDGAEGRVQPKDFFFFSKKSTLSNALKSMLVLHDPRRMSTDNAVRKMPVAGGLPCFMNNLPLKTVTSSTIGLDFGNGIDATIINNMKWSTAESDKANKTAYLSALLLMVYAELFDFDDPKSGKKRLRPDKLNWSYPSSMEENMVSIHYNPIWRDLGNASPILDENGKIITLQVAQKESSGNVVFGQQSSGDQSSEASQQQGGEFDFNGGLFQEKSTASNPSILSGGIFGPKEPTPEPTKPETINLEPDDPKKHLTFNEVNTKQPMTEACASANNTAQNYDAQSNIVYCFDVGGSTTDISAIFKRDGVKASMIKQNSIRFAAQKISQAVRETPDEFRKVLDKVCDAYKISLIGFNVGEKRYSADTAPYYYEQIVDMLDGEQLKFFYGRVAEYCPRLFAVNLYVTGLIMFYAGQLLTPLYNAILANLEDPLDRILESGVNPISGIQFVFAGKGARIFDWLSVRDYNLAIAYFRAMFKAGVGRDIRNDTIDLNELYNGKSNEDVKFEVSKGLASEDGNIEAPTESFEIFGENGFNGFSNDGKNYSYTFDTKLTPEWMRLIGSGTIRQPQPNCQCFMTFLNIYAGALQRILGITMNKNEITLAISQMKIVQYLTQEVPGFIEAMKRYRGGQEFDFVAPIIIIEGMRFYDKHLLKCF